MRKMMVVGLVLALVSASFVPARNRRMHRPVEPDYVIQDSVSNSLFLIDSVNLVWQAQICNGDTLSPEGLSQVTVTDTLLTLTYVGEDFKAVARIDLVGHRGNATVQPLVIQTAEATASATPEETILTTIPELHAPYVFSDPDTTNEVAACPDPESQNNHMGTYAPGGDGTLILNGQGVGNAIYSWCFIASGHQLRIDPTSGEYSLHTSDDFTYTGQGNIERFHCRNGGDGRFALRITLDTEHVFLFLALDQCARSATATFIDRDNSRSYSMSGTATETFTCSP